MVNIVSKLLMSLYKRYFEKHDGTYIKASLYIAVGPRIIIGGCESRRTDLRMFDQTKWLINNTKVV